MKSFITEILAIDPKTDELTTYAGDIINAVNWQHAEMILEGSERGYMMVVGVLEEEILYFDYTLN